MNNLFAGLSALAPGSSSAAGESSAPGDIPKEELMSLCMKMNKRMQGMEAKGKELVKKKATLLAERHKLLEIFKTVMPMPVLPKEDADLDLSAVERAWADFDTNRRDQIAELEAKVVAKDQLMQQSLKSVEERYKKMLSDLRSTLPAAADGTESTYTNQNGAENNNSAESTDSASIQAILEAEREKMVAQTALQELQRRVAKSDSEVERFRGVETYLKQQLQTMEGVIVTKNSEIDALQKELEQNKITFEEKIVHLQLQMSSVKGKEEERGKDSLAHKATIDKLNAQIAALQRLIEEKDLSYKSNKDMIQALQARIIELEPELAQCKDKLSQHERNNNAQAVMKAEQSALAQSLRSDLKVALDELEAAKKRSRELEEFKVKAEGQLLKMNSISEQAQTLQSAMEDKDSLITRMRSEQQASERNHAMRTAMLATCEAQLETLQKELATKDETSQEMIERVTSLQAALSSCEARLAERVKEATAEISGLQAKVVAIEKASEETIRSLKQTHEENVEAIKRDHAKKSAMARTLLSEKEDEVRTLSAKVTELQDEISSGAPQERKIFDLASTQAKRETLHGVHNDTRELAFSQLQNKLAAKDFELARVQQVLSAIQSEVVELRRTHQREGINMDYLKNIVIQYMTFPAQSSEKMSLVPVLATLLQFTPKELSAVQRATLLEPTGGSLWSSFGLSGGAKGPSAMPIFSSSRPAKEVKRPTSSAVATSPAPAGGAKGVGGKTPTNSPGATSMTPNTSTTAALVGAKGDHRTPTTSPATAAPTTPGLGTAAAAAIVAASANNTSAVKPVAGPLSPSTSNSDAEQSDHCGYSPPKLPAQQPAHQQQGYVPPAPSNGSKNGSLMMESHTDTGHSDDPTYATPRKSGDANVHISPAGTHEASFNRGKIVSPDGRIRGSMHRILNKSGSMNASDYEFQQKLKSIGSDILSMDNSVSYDDNEIDMGADATYVDYEEGIEEGDELDDGLDGTSV